MAIVRGTKKADFIAAGPTTPGVTGSITDLGDQIDAAEGDDRVFAGAGNDRALGGTGNDLLNMGAGNDTANGGRGNDTLTGGEGNDTFVLTDGGRDLITDFDRRTTDVAKLTFDDITDLVTLPADYAGWVWSNFLGEKVGGNGQITVIDTTDTIDAPAGVVLTYLDITELSGSGWSLFATNEAGVSESIEVTAVGRLDLTKYGIAVNSMSIFEDENAPGVLAIGEIGYELTTGDDDRIQVGSIKQRDALVASAVSDGNGNTLMGKGADTVTLLGVDPAQVSTEWFLIG